MVSFLFKLILFWNFKCEIISVMRTTYQVVEREGPFSRFYLISSHKCENHTLKIRFNLQDEFHVFTSHVMYPSSQAYHQPT